MLCECEIETLATNWADQLSSLNTSRIKLYRDLAEFFRTIRSTCQSINETNEQFNDKLFNDNQISKLPVDTFENILEADEFNYVKLKVVLVVKSKTITPMIGPIEIISSDSLIVSHPLQSLVQLIKLEISELLTLIIFYCSVNKADLYESLKRTSAFVAGLTVDAKRFNQQIAEDCYYFTKFFMRTRDEDQPERTKIDPSQNEILFNLKSAKTKICSSLLM